MSLGQALGQLGAVAKRHGATYWDPAEKYLAELQLLHFWCQRKEEAQPKERGGWQMGWEGLTLVPSKGNTEPTWKAGADPMVQLGQQQIHTVGNGAAVEVSTSLSGCQRSGERRADLGLDPHTWLCGAPPFRCETCPSWWPLAALCPTSQSLFSHLHTRADGTHLSGLRVV